MQITRAKQILMQQDQEWSKFIAEESESQALIRYGFLFIILSNVAAVVAASYTGFGWFNYYLTMQIVSTAVQVGMLFFIPTIFARIAPNFGGQDNKLNAQKLYVFSMTPAWVASLLVVIPTAGGILALAGALYSLYLLWKHAGEAMSISQEKSTAYVAACVVVVIVAFIVTGAVAAGIASSMFGMPNFARMSL